MSGDPECEVMKYYANLEADQFRNMENARKLWADILLIHQFKVKFVVFPKNFVQFGIMANPPNDESEV